MIKVIFLPKVKERPIRATKSFYVDTHNYAEAEKLARAEFSGTTEYQEYGMAVCIDISVIYP